MRTEILNIYTSTSIIKALLEGTIVSISNSNAISLQPYCFYSNSIVSASFVNIKTINNNAFYECTSLKSVSLPSCTFIGEDAFNGCSSLSMISLPVCINIKNWAFHACLMLKCIFRIQSTCNTTIPSLNGSIYVPVSLVNTYKTDSVWSKYKNIIFSF